MLGWRSEPTKYSDEKSKQCSDAIDDLKQSLSELYKSKFDAIQKNFEDKLSLMQSRAEGLDTQLKLLEAKGRKADASIYQKQIEEQQGELEVKKQQLADMLAAFNDAKKNKVIEEGSEEWYAMMLEIQRVKNEIAETDVTIAELNNSIRQLQWDSFDSALELISDLNDEADFLINILSDKKLTDATGKLTAEGLAVIGLHAQNIDILKAKSHDYANEIARLDEEIAKDPLNQTLIDRRKELLELQRDSISAIQDEKEAMKDLVSDGIDAQLDAVKKLIDAYNDSLDSAKDLYEFQKSIAEKSKAVSDIEKQLAAYQGDNSEETRTTIQKLKSDLKKAQEDLKDTEYDRYVSDTKEMLDEFYSDYEETLNAKLDDIDTLIEKLIDTVNSNSGNILSTLTKNANEVGIGLSKELTSIWSNPGAASNIISASADKVSDRVSAVFDVAKGIYESVCLIAGQNPKSYATGGLVDYTGIANVHGSKSKPELMLNANDTQNFLKLRDALRNADIPMIQHTIGMDYSKLITKIITVPNASNETNYSNCGNTVIEIDHVQDYNDFVRQLQHDDKFERMIQDMTIRRAMGEGPFNKYLHKWK